MADLNSLVLFAKVAECGTFTETARRLSKQQRTSRGNDRLAPETRKTVFGAYSNRHMARPVRLFRDFVS